jgi:hypothetical protein
MKSKNQIIKELSPHLFWDCKFENIDFDKQSLLVIERIYTRGTDKDRAIMYYYYGIEKLKKLVLKIPRLDKKTLNFISIVLGLPKRDFACYRKTAFPKD